MSSTQKRVTFTYVFLTPSSSSRSLQNSPTEPFTYNRDFELLRTTRLVNILPKGDPHTPTDSRHDFLTSGTRFLFTILEFH